MKKKKKKSPYPSGEHVHSLLLSSSQKSDIDLKQEELIAIPNAFPLLRVLEIQSFKLSFQLPDELFSLNLLKYLAITTNLNLLPKAFKNLHELQTLVIKTTERTLEIEGGIWNMEKLRHVETNASMQLPSPPQKTRRQNNTRKTNIRTLSSISPTSCQKEIFSMTPHLKKLGVRGNLVELLEEKPQQICLFNNLQMLKGLENLKLYGENEGAMGALKVPMLDMFAHRLRKVPMLDMFAHRLRKLSFCNTFFKWDDMRILGSLEELEVLKLDENAFRGEEWDLKSDVVFNQLQYLRIGRTNLETWTILENSFPVLENLVLRNCTNLKEIPSAFAQVHNLKVIELYHMSENANNSARQIAEQMSENANNSAGQVAEQMSENANNSAGQVAEQISENANNSAGQSTKMTPGVEEDIVVGFGEEAKIIKDLLFIESMNLRVISIVGMIGVGKTTLARMLFNDVDLQYEFFTRIWVNVSRVCDRRRIFYYILSRFTSISNDFHEMSEEHLAEKVKEYLKGSKYLIVLDDVWTEHDWFRLRIAFPNNVRRGKILVTTRSQDVPSFIGSIGISHELKGLSDDECWELLEKKIFGGSRCPDTSLEAVGRSIAKKFEGVLLLVGKISDVLRENRTVAEWERIKSNPFASIEYENDEVMMEMINYDMMRDYSKMKACLLYLAAFPRGFEIDARELVYLWVAEGLIWGDDDLEYKGEYYIREFVRINLLMVVSRRADDRIKRVRIHGFLHEICIREAAKPQNNVVFLSEFQVEGGGGAYGRGLYIHSSSSALALQAASSSSDQVRSFLSFSSQGSIQEIAAAIPNAFPNLQVLNFTGFIFPNLPKELYRLKHLTYLGITITDLKLLPKEFESLTHLQTLVLHTDDTQNSTCVEIEADIWSCMPNLRHLLTTTSRLQLQLPSPIIRRSSIVSKITTLSTISPRSCTPEILDKTPQIKKLGICGNLDYELMDVNQEGVSLFDNLHKLDRLENLKLININDALQSNRLGSFRFPPAESFPSRLRKMTLSNTSFQWRHFSVLGSLYTLEVLKLENNAFRGEFCDVRSVVFKKLQYFRIERTDLVSWAVSKDSFPVLKCLSLRYCTELEAVPVEFGEIESLKLLELYCTNEWAVRSAHQILRFKGYVYGDTKKGGFQLSVYPPEP
nr:putative late blight resistance protein homolog R1B-14 [Ipomoea batatas]